MAYKILGQAALTTTNSDIYAVPTGSESVISTLQLNNTGVLSAKATVFVRKFDGTLAAAAASNAFSSDILVAPGQPVSFTVGVTIAAGDTITAVADSADLITIHLFGNESEL